MPIFWYLASFCVVAWLLFKFSRKNKNGIKLPPGPRGLPIIGNVHQLGGYPPAKFSEWAKKYGKLCTIYFGNNPALVVSDAQLMKQVFGTMASTGKFQNIWFNLIVGRNAGIINTEGKDWQEQRNFLFKAMKDFGFGSQRSYHVEAMILSEAGKLCKKLEQEMGTDGKVYLSETLKESSGSTLWSIVTGKKITPRVVYLLEEIVRVTQIVVRSGLIFFPGLRYLAPGWSGFNEGKRVAKEINEVVETSFMEHRNSREEGQYDIVSAYIEHLDNMKSNPSSTFYGAAGENHSFKSVVALLVAGIETTATTLNWLIFYLCVHPDAQAKMQAEIDEVVGRDRDPTMEDKDRLPYTEAVILESLRMASTIAFGIIHKLLEDVSVEGYRLPKGMFLIANIYHANNDPEVWGDPENFRPERFLEGEGKQTVKGNLKDYITSFQPGRRSCVGEPIARDAMFLYVVKLFKTFVFCPEEKSRKEDYMKQNLGLLMSPNHMAVRVFPRNEHA